MPLDEAAGEVPLQVALVRTGLGVAIDRTRDQLASGAMSTGGRSCYAVVSEPWRNDLPNW